MSKIKKTIVALIYDFDGTLSPQNMQEYGFMQELGIKKPKEFWAKSAQLSKDTDTSGILCYMKTMIDTSHEKGKPFTKKKFKEYGESVELFNGVKEWFSLINNFGKKNGLNIKHYINSSGLKEMIEGTSIAKEFEKIYACTFIYDENGAASWPGVAVDFTNKTQFIYKINKGISEVSDNKKINEYVEEEKRPVPFKRMIYFGDGETDIPCMKTVKQNGGYSIAVYQQRNSKKKNTANKLILDNRVNFVCPADYTEGKLMYDVVTTILRKIKYDYDFDQLQNKHKEEAKKIKKQ